MNRHTMTKRPFAKLFAPLVPALALLLAGCDGASAPPVDPPLAGARIGGPFTLSDAQGRTVRWSDFEGKYRIVYFGYAYCPDVCPFDVQNLMKGYAKYAGDHPDLARQVQPIFISIDPERDTPQVVGEFTSAFSDRLLGLTGSPEQIAVTAKAFGAYYKKGEPVAGGGYLMDHTRGAYLMGRKGEPIALLPVDEGADAVAAEMTRWIR